ncbi:hypothetical protein CANMA_000004 [Candida margitis]|uniref:uncharacterized protein n=1 Tax=Candida margitis TaxID=1775924 RepID=UPI0022265578|nr:uncharacterized protein CANMA_000004 [Candida margitis]KAI5970844.1 hypothetical protein CANMA_000004 [Candida margitis]
MKSEESKSLHPSSLVSQQDPSHIKQEVDHDAQSSAALSNKNNNAQHHGNEDEANDEINSMPFDELQQLYHTLQDRFKTVSTELATTYEEEQNQRKTLAYYQRRNQAILNILEHLEDNNTINNNMPIDDTASAVAQRIKRIVDKVPRLARLLSPLTHQHHNLSSSSTTSSSSSNIPISSNTLLNAYLMEHIPDLIDDDLSSIEINPQSIESWCRRNYNNSNRNHNSSNTSLVSGTTAKPITIQMLNRLNEYNGVEFDLGIDGKLIVTPQAASSSSKKRRRK